MAVAVAPRVAAVRPALPLRVVLGVEDVASTGAALACLAGLRLLTASDRLAALGDPATGAPLVGLTRRRPVEPVDAPAPRVSRLTFAVATEEDLRAAATAAVRQGGRLLRALDYEDATGVHIGGPDGFEIGLVHRRSPSVGDLGPGLVFSPDRLVGCGLHREGRRSLDHVHVAAKDVDAVAVELSVRSGLDATRTGPRTAALDLDGQLAGVVTLTAEPLVTRPTLHALGSLERV